MAMANSSARKKPDPGSAEIEASVRAALIRQLYGTPAFMLLHPVIAAIGALALWSVYPNWAIAIWLALGCLVTAVRFLDRRRYLLQTDQTHDAEYWGRHFVLGAIAAGCLWGLMASALVLTPDTESQVFVFELLAGLAATAVATQATHLPALLGFIIPIFSSLLVATFVRQGSVSVYLGLGLVAFAGVLIAIGRTINRRTADTLRLQIAGRALTDNVEAASAELRRRDTILRTMLASATELMRSFDLDHSMAAVLKLAGESTNVSRVSILQNSQGPDGRLYISGRYEWNAPGISPGLGNRLNPRLQNIDFKMMGLDDWAQAMEKGEARTAIIRLLECPARELFEQYGIKSVLAVPVFVQGSWWGEVSFDDCDTERRWSTVEIDTLKTIAELVGAAIGHGRDLGELETAARIIENSSTILYRVKPTLPYELTYISRNTARYGYARTQFLSNPAFYLDLIHPEDRENVTSDVMHLAQKQIGSEIVREYRIRKPDGTYVWFEGRIRGIYDKSLRLTEIEGVLIDISERKTAEATITRFEMTDQLTGLASRKSFMEQLTHAFVAAKRGGAGFAILYLDLDRFKDINDVLGHTKGDELLTVVADRLRTVQRATDDIARFGGDEFAVLQRDASDPSDAGALASRILGALSAPYNIGTEVHITASIGIAVYDADVAGPEELMKRADLALYRAKDAGRNQYHFHSEALDVEVRERVTLGEELRTALERHELEMYYQPQVAVPSGIINGLEALVRWNHPSRRVLLPSTFIPVAEKAGTIVRLGHWIVDDVCRQVGLWRAELPTLPKVSINLSAAQLKPSLDFDLEFAAILRKYGLDGTAIELELTESVLMQTTRENSQMIERLRALGASLAIDDFGTGYSSMEYLGAFQASHIKIAQEFIRDLGSDAGHAAIVRATIGLARELGIKVIAEGVETAKQLDFLIKAGCENIQGNFFSRPVPASEAGRLLRKGRLEPTQPARGQTAPNIAEGAMRNTSNADSSSKGDLA